MFTSVRGLIPSPWWPSSVRPSATFWILSLDRGCMPRDPILKSAVYFFNDGDGRY